LECPKISLLIVGRNLLPAFGFNFAICLTFHTNKQQLITLSHLKDALRAHAAAATWSKEQPFVLLRLRAQLREDTGLSPAEALFDAQIVLPNEYLQNEEFSVDDIIKNFSKTLHVSAPSLLRHNSITDLPRELPAKLLSAPLIWVRWGGVVSPLQPLYDGPYAVLRHGPPLLHHPSRVAGRGGRCQPP
jgi:hypothetical protein